MIIIVTGSSGTGKTEISKVLARKISALYVDVTKLITEKKVPMKYIRKFDSYEVDASKVSKMLIKLIKVSDQNLVIDSHLSHYIPSKYIDYCVVCKCNIKILKKRLEKRKYNPLKIRENLDSEIFDVCLIEALENKHKVIVIDTSSQNIVKSVNFIIKKIK